MIMVLVYQSERELNPFTTNQTNRRLSIEGRHGNRCWLISPVNVILLPLNCFRIVWKWNLTSMGKKDYSCGINRFKLPRIQMNIIVLLTIPDGWYCWLVSFMSFLSVNLCSPIKRQQERLEMATCASTISCANAHCFLTSMISIIFLATLLIYFAASTLL